MCAAPLLELESPACNGCGRADAALVYEARDLYYQVDPRPFRVVRCRGCELVYLTPRPTPAAIAAAYPPDYLWSCAVEEAPTGAPLEERLRARYFRHKSDARAGWVDRLLGGNREAAVLDVGCGRGGFLKALRRRGYRSLTGYELGEANAAALRTECPDLAVVAGDFLAVDPPRGQMEALTMWHVLEHLHDPRAALARAAALLRPGGLLVLGTQNFDAFSRRAMGPSWPLNDVPRHLYHFTRETLDGLLGEAGFRREREWRLTEFFPCMGGYLLAPWLMRPDHSLRVLPGLAAQLALGPLELALALVGRGCILTVAARKEGAAASVL